MINIEDLGVEKKAIPQRQLLSTWTRLTNKPFPEIRALLLGDNAFDHILRSSRCEEDELRELEEWNRTLTTKGTDACIFNSEPESGFDYTILIRENHYHSLEKIIRHELSHIVKGDL
jgi:hypothetical protein